MKISYRTHPPLRILKSQSINGFRVSNEIASSAKDVDQVIKKHVSYFRKSIKVFSHPFADAAIKASSKAILSGVFNDFENQLNTSGTLIVAHYTFFFIIEPNFKLFLMFAEDGLIAYRARQGENDVYWCDKNMLEGKDQEFITAYWETIIVALLFFLEYAEVQVKNVPAKSKKVEINCKYINETDFNYTIYNSSWFTTLVKSDSFKVRGHFRLQPFGDGLKDRKLIWINEFVKEGYTAPARKLSHT